MRVSERHSAEQVCLKVLVALDYAFGQGACRKSCSSFALRCECIMTSSSSRGVVAKSARLVTLFMINLQHTHTDIHTSQGRVSSYSSYNDQTD